MAPADDSDALGVDAAHVLDRPVARGLDVVDLGAAVVDLVVHVLAVAGRAAILRRDDDVALIDQLAHDVRV